MANLNPKPRVSEKAAIIADKVNAYVFDVVSSMNKGGVAKFVKATYKVTPVKVNIVRRGNDKKAYVYLKKGEKIEII